MIRDHSIMLHKESMNYLHPYSGARRIGYSLPRHAGIDEPKVNILMKTMVH